MIQYLDIAFWLTDDQMIAVEVDGSHGYHGMPKSAAYDEIKTRYLESENIPFVNVRDWIIQSRTVHEIANYILEAIGYGVDYELIRMEEKVRLDF